MFDDLLPQTCQITKQTVTQDEWNPENYVDEILYDNVPCKFDSLLLTRTLSTTDQISMPARTRGTVFISGDYGSGGNRKFNEKNSLLIDGERLEIIVVHDVWAADYVHHYEVEVNRGINR